MEELRQHIFDLEQVASGLAEGFQGFLGKLAGLAGSLALILHLGDDPDEGRIHAVSKGTGGGSSSTSFCRTRTSSTAQPRRLRTATGFRGSQAGS